MLSLALPGFQTLALLYDGPASRVFRAQRLSDGAACIVKMLPVDAPRSDGSRLRYEHRILETLANAAARHVVRSLELHDREGRLALVLEDVGGVSLREAHQQQALDVHEAVHVATVVATALTDIHAARIVHKDINPNNIVYNRATGVVQLIDFNIASQLVNEVQSLDSLRSVEGTLAYVSPEQTGKMNRPLDYRSDFYSLGVTLYEILAGHLPFVETDISQLAHAILAKKPKSLAAAAPHVVAPLRAIVDKMLEKAPGDRYQSAHGLAHDLRECARILKGDANADAFAIARNDMSERFELPHKLYGREKEIAELLAAYTRTAHGTREVLLVRGPSGMGKSQLVNEVQRAITQHNGIFASGKFDQLRRHIPFAALGLALGGIIRRIMMEDEGTVEAWRKHLQWALGNVGQALVEIAPAIELLVGKQKPLPALAPQENESRLMLLLERTMRTICATQPLVLFLDDVQWADSASLKFLVMLATSSSPVAGLLLIASYRDDEIPTGHPLRASIAALETSGTPVHAVSVAPLQVADIVNLIADATQESGDHVNELARLVFRKTAGNPFFVRSFLNVLRDRGLIHLSADRRAWQWDIDSIGRAAVADNVVTLIADRLRTLPATEQALLSAAASLGGEFKLSVLCYVCDLDRLAVASGLHGATEAEIVLPLGGNYRYIVDSEAEVTYAFAHDRVQQAAYEAQPEESRRQMHLRIGRRLMESGGESFAVADHLNRAQSLITEDTERLQLARVNLLCATEAKHAASYPTAIVYAEAGLAIMGAKPWELDETLARALNLELADDKVLNGDLPGADAALALMLERSHSARDRAEVLRRRALAMTSMGNSIAALEAGEQALRLLGFDLRIARPTIAQVVVSLVRTELTLLRRKPDELARMPHIQDRRLLMALEVLCALSTPAFQLGELAFATVALTVLRISAKHGLSPLAAFSYVTYMVMLHSTFNLRKERTFARVLHDVLRAVPDSALRGATVFCDLATAGMSELTPEELYHREMENWTLCIERGESIFGSLSSGAGVGSLWWASLDKCVEESVHVMGYLKACGPELYLLLRGVVQTARALRGETLAPDRLDDNEGFAAEAFEREISAFPGNVAPAWYFATKVGFCWCNRDMDGAVSAARLAFKRRALNAVHATGQAPFFALALIAVAATRKSRRIPEGRIFRAVMKKVRAAADSGPARFGGAHLLILAEVAALRGRHTRAAQLYERANEALEHSGYTCYRAAGLECAGRFYAARGLHIAASSHLRQAAGVYRTWGAPTKARALEVEFPTYFADAELLQQHSATRRGPATQRSSVTSTSKSAAHHVDVAALIRATQAVSSEVNLDKLMSKIVAGLLESAGASRAALLLLRGDKMQPAVDSAAQGSPLPIELVTYVARSRETVVINDASAPHDFSETEYFRAPTVRSVLCTPVLHQGDMIGALYLENDLAGNVFAADNLLIVNVLAAQAAISLVNSRLYASLEDAVAERTGALEQAHQKLLKYEKQTTEVQMAGGFAHEMRNSLGAAKYGIDYLLSEDMAADVEALRSRATAADQGGLTALMMQGLGAIREKAQESRSVLVQVDSSLERGLKITREILAYAQAGELRAGPGETDLKAVVDKILADFAQTFSEHTIECVTRLSAEARTLIREEHAYIILRNLLANACDALSHSAAAPRTIEVEQRFDHGHVYLTVKDSGPGIPDDVQSRIFQPFFSTKGAAGVGLGLGLSKKLAELYGGELGFTSQAGRGATFTVSLPHIVKPNGFT